LNYFYKLIFDQQHAAPQKDRSPRYPTCYATGCIQNTKCDGCNELLLPFGRVRMEQKSRDFLDWHRYFCITSTTINTLQCIKQENENSSQPKIYTQMPALLQNDDFLIKN